jgi:hypothetical protein
MKLKYEKGSSVGTKGGQFSHPTDNDNDFFPTLEEWGSMSDKDKLVYTHDCILELYLNIKMRNFEQDKQSIDNERVDEELGKLSHYIQPHNL